MSKINVLFFISNEDSLQFKLDNITNESLIIYFQLLSIFADINEEKKLIELNALHKATEELKDSMKQFVDKYKGEDPRFNKLTSFFRDLNDDEWFYVLPRNDLGLKKSFYIQESLNLLDKGYIFDEVKKILEEKEAKFNNTFSNVLKDYHIIPIPCEKKIYIGENNKKKRVCRFCKKSKEDGATFKHIAHAIPEALGNKNIINNEECDECNSKFEKMIERDLINYLNIYRVFWGIKGKNGVPKIKFKDDKLIDYQNDIFYIQDTVDNDSQEPIDFPNNIKLEPYYSINMMDVYRCFCKISLSVIDKKFIKYFNETIKWINKNKSLSNNYKLPKIAMLLNPQNFNEQPNITLYIRKSDNTCYPLLVSELRIYTFIFVYIVPFSSKDNREFIEEEYQDFWSKFEHYHGAGNWNFKNFSSDIDQDFIINLKLDKKE